MVDFSSSLGYGRGIYFFSFEWLKFSHNKHGAYDLKCVFCHRKKYVYVCLLYVSDFIKICAISTFWPNQVSYGSELSNRGPTFDMDLSDFMDRDQPISYEKAKEYFAKDPSQS